MSIRGVRLTRDRVKRLLGGAMFCLSLSLIACGQAEKSSSKNDSQNLTVQSANSKNDKNRAAIPQRTPGEITVVPTPFPSAAPEAIPSVAPKVRKYLNKTNLLPKVMVLFPKL